MSQTYTAVGDTPIPASVTVIPTDSIGTQGILLAGPIGGQDFNYRNQISNINTAGNPVTGTANSANMFAEFQDFITKWMWVASGGALTKGLSPTTDAAGNTVTGGNPYASVTPREVILRVKFMCEAMLSQSNG